MSTSNFFALRDENTKFKYWKFLFLYLIQLCLPIAASLLVFSLFPIGGEILRSQYQSAWYSYAEWFIGGHFALSGFEWGYHRYMLHKAVISWFKSQWRTHTLHHSLTDVTTIKNEYEIQHSHQNEAATFPWYALIAFSGIFTPLIWVLQALSPGSPVIVCSYSAMAFSLVLYEIYHAAMHLDYDKYWKKSVERFSLVRQLYGFHLMHHASIRVNQAIGGFFFLPIWDWVFGTYFVPTDSLPLPGKVLPQPIPPPPKPRWLTRALDKLAASAHKRVAQQSKT